MDALAFLAKTSKPLPVYALFGDEDFLRRRCREALRMAIEKLPERASVQLLVSPRAASLDAPFTQLQAEVTSVLALLSTSCQTPPKNRGSSSSR